MDAEFCHDLILRYRDHVMGPKTWRKGEEAAWSQGKGLRRGRTAAA